jgi:beta-galactosidase
MGMSAQRQISDFNFGWKFHLGEYPVEQLQNAFTDDSDWRDIDVPHDFQIEQPWVAPSADENANNSDGASNFKSRLSARAFKEMGSGWYVKKYVPEMSLKNKRTIIDFEGIMYVGDVYLNGERIGGTDYGYLGFEIDLSNKLKY